MKIDIKHIENNILGINMSNAVELIWRTTKEQRKELYSTMCLVMNGDIITKKQEVNINEEIYDLIHEMESNIKLYHIPRNIKWQSNSGSFIISLDNKKLFCKIYKKPKEYSIYKDVAREFNGLCRMKAHGYKVIEPIMYYDDAKNDNNIIVYPFMKDFKNWTDCLIDRDFPQEKIEKMKEIYKKACNEMEPLWIKDIKYENIYYNSEDDEFYFFDCIDSNIKKKLFTLWK